MRKYIKKKKEPADKVVKYHTKDKKGEIERRKRREQKKDT